MAKILLGWELGAHRGHIIRLLRIADALVSQGHDVALGLQNIGLFPADRVSDFTLFQAPVWPRLLSNTLRTYTNTTQTMGDILYRLGLDNPDTMVGLVSGWQQIFKAFQPQLVIGDFAPIMGVAARGRCPVLHVGAGFMLPPADMPTFPDFFGKAPAHNEAVTLENVNQGLALLGEQPLAALPEMFSADRQLAGCFAELDPYAAFRKGEYAPPSLAGVTPRPVDGGEEIFVYSFEGALRAKAFWAGLHSTGLKVRIHIPGLHEDGVQALTAMGFMVEREIVSFTDIARRSHMVISHGSHGFTSSAILAGLPHFIAHYDMEKRLNGLAVKRLYAGDTVALTNPDKMVFADHIERVFNDTKMRAELIRFANKVGNRMKDGPVAPVIRAAHSLLP